MNPKNTAPKRIFIMACCLLLTFLLAACSGNGNNRQPPKNYYMGETETEPADASGTEPADASGTEPVDASGTETAYISPSPEEPVNVRKAEESGKMKMYVQVGDSIFAATMEKNASAEAFMELMENGPVVIRMSDYSGFEKVGSTGTALPDGNSQITTQSGDIVLYNGSRIVIFYGSNSWSYTRLGKIDDLTGWEEALGDGDVTVTFSLNENG